MDAISELYLKDMDGFFLLDDPFTDMDTTRRAAMQTIEKVRGKPPGPLPHLPPGTRQGVAGKGGS